MGASISVVRTNIRTKKSLHSLNPSVLRGYSQANHSYQKLRSKRKEVSDGTYGTLQCGIHTSKIEALIPLVCIRRMAHPPLVVL